jgi:fructose-bisphosphate aldolase/6-deoxy-5-ketofructose 1-phosphate synthase
MSKPEKLFLFAGDQKVEHMNRVEPEYLFKIASRAPVSALATQLGLISHYGPDYKNINYVVKLNSKTNLIPAEQKDPVSLAMYSVQDVVQFKKDSGLSVVGVGYTVYLGSEFESQMLHQAAQAVLNARQNGLISILWIYPRGKSVKNERDAGLIAGAAGVGACLGADFVKINQPDGGPQELKQAVASAGKTKIICAGGKKVDESKFLQELEAQVAAGVSGCAIGRNIFERDFDEAVSFCEKVAKIALV